MVPTTGVVEQEQEQQPQPAVAAVVPAISPKTLRSRARATADGDTSPSTSPDAAMEATAEEAAGLPQQPRRRGRYKKSDVPLDNRERIKKRVKYLLIKMRVDQNLLDAYSGEGWKGQSREKIRPVRELQRAEAQILRSKLALREAVHELDDMGLEGSLDENLFDAEGRIYHEEIFCAKCKSQEALLENDIILCDGACNRGFHQYCLDPPLETKDIPPGDEGWLCPVCECKMECVELINAQFGTNYEVENSWEEVFSKEALLAAGGGTGKATGGEWPSSDSEDDDYDPEAGEKRANSEDETESKEVGDDRVGDEDEEDSDYMEDGEGREGDAGREDDKNEEDSDSGSDFRENKGSSGAGEKVNQEPSTITNLKKLARKGKRRRRSSKEDSASSDSSNSDASDVSFFDEFKDSGPKLGSRRRDSQAQPSASDEEVLVVEGKRQRQALDYKRLHDEMFGNVNDTDEEDEDEDYGPKRRRRSTISDDPSRPKPPQVRRKIAQTSSEDASKRVDAEGVQPSDGGASKRILADGVQSSDGGASKPIDADGVQSPGGDASKLVDADDAQPSNGDASKRIDADSVQIASGGISRGMDLNGVPRDFSSGSQVDGAADTPGADREKRMWRRLPDAAVEVLRRVVAVNALPSKPQKELLAAELGLTFAQVHGWFKNQRHQALRKGLVTPKRPHLVASSSKGANAATVAGVEMSASVEAATEIMAPQDLNSANTILTEKLGEVETRLLELKETLDVFAKDTVEEGAEGRSVEVKNNFEPGGIGLPGNGNHVVYVPAVEVRENATCEYPYST